MLLQILPERFAQNTHAAAVNHADAWESCQKGAVEEFFDFRGGLIHCAADIMRDMATFQSAGVTELPPP